MADDPNNRMPWTHRLAACRAATAALLSLAASVHHPTWHLILLCAITAGNGCAAVSQSFVFLETRHGGAPLLVFSSTGRWRGVGKNVCRWHWLSKSSSQPAEDCSFRHGISCWSNIMNAAGKNQRVYIFSLCFKIHKGPESTIDMTFWVSNFSVEVCLYREEKFFLPFFVKALQELSKLY